LRLHLQLTSYDAADDNFGKRGSPSEITPLEGREHVHASMSA
jgi:hypothetical protein